MYKLLLLVLIAAVSCSDLIQGPEGGRKIYDEDKEASPAIWKQINRVTVKANDTEVITRIVVKDLRPDKDGEASIVAGGQGHKNVTIELKSPTILRGYSFHVDVFAAEDQAYPDFPEEPIPTGQVPYPITDELHPEGVNNDTQINHGAEKDGSKINAETPVVVATEATTTTLTQESTTGAATTVTNIRQARNVVHEPINKQTATTHHSLKDFSDYKGTDYVTEKSVADAGNISKTPVENSTTHVDNSTTHVDNSTTHVDNSTAPVENQTTHAELSTTHVVSSTTPVDGSTASVVSSTTARANPKAFHDITKEVGEEVVFGIEHQ